jgi:mRNA interferase RelE/StbE
LARTIEYTESARRQLRKLDKQSAHRIVACLNERIAPLEDPRGMGKALRGPLGDFWRYRVGEFRIICALRDKTFRVLVVRIGNRKKTSTGRLF